jgi:WXG100 family type VII secretion target
MGAPKVRSDYQGLRQIASLFGRQADASRQTTSNLKNRMEKLRGGDWVGKGANKFYGEMDSSVLPTITRLVAAMDKASSITDKIAKIMKQAEDDSSACFKL